MVGVEGDNIENMESIKSKSSRRSFMAGSTAAATAFTIVRPELVRGWAPERLKAGLVGCGGRGRQAVLDMFKGDPSIDLVSMGDIFEDKLDGNLRWLNAEAAKNGWGDRVKVAPDMRFLGFDAYKKVLASGVDVVMLAAPPAWRPAHFEAAIEAGKHVFCEKPFGTDPVNVRRFMAAAKKSVEKKLTVVSGAQRRSDPAYIEDVSAIQNGKMGEVVALYAYWMGTPVVQQPNGLKPEWAELEGQHRNWYSNLWLCGDQIVEQHLHNIDVCNWIMGTHPVSVAASGGATWRPQDIIHGNIYDHISSDFEYANGVHMSSYCRQYPNECFMRVEEVVAGSKGRKTLQQTKGGPGYWNEHSKLMKSIRGDGPYINEGMSVAESTMTCIMGRESAYSGVKVTWDMIMASEEDLMPKEDQWKMDGKHPATPFPVPGKYKFR
jgi:predicted dehydrogenase